MDETPPQLVEVRLVPAVPGYPPADDPVYMPAGADLPEPSSAFFTLSFLIARLVGRPRCRKSRG